MIQPLLRITFSGKLRVIQQKGHNVKISVGSKIGFSALCVIFLLPLFTYPVSLDLAVFARGGEVLLKGGTLYTDYLDLKPPVIHYLLAIAQLVTPGGESGLRLFDFVWQLATAFLLAKVVSAITSDERTGYTSAVLYTLVYTAGFYESTFQCESFLALPFTLFLYLQVFKNYRPRYRFALGVLVGICIGLKFTFGIIAAIWLLDEIVFKKTPVKILLKDFFLVSSGIVITLLFIYFPVLMSAESRSAFKEILGYTSRYAALPVVDKELVRMAIFKTGGAITDIFSLSYFVFCVLSVRTFFKKINEATLRHAVFVSVAGVLLLLFSAVLERKFFDYHYTRAYIPVCFLTAVGAISFLDFLKRNKTFFLRSERFLFLIFIPLALVFSPLLSWGSLVAGVSTAFFTNTEHYNSLIERSPQPGFKSQRQQQKEVVQFLKENNPDQQKVLVIGMDAARIGYFLKDGPFSKFPTAQFYLGSTAGLQWRRDAMREFESAGWLIGQQNDASPYAYDGMSAWQAATSDTLFAPYIYANFEEIKNTGYYRILKRK